MNNRIVSVWILLGLIAMLTMPMMMLVWPAQADGHRLVPAAYEVQTGNAPLEIQTSIMPSFLNDHLAATASYTSYLPIITNVSLPEPLNTLITLINAERQKHRLMPLRINPILMQVAQAHSQNMMEQGFFDHIDPTGANPCQRIANAGYAPRSCAENIAAGHPTALAVFQSWMNSPGHRANILSPDFTEIGLGYAEGGYYGYYWTVDLACPR